LPVILTNE